MAEYISACFGGHELVGVPLEDLPWVGNMNCNACVFCNADSHCHFSICTEGQVMKDIVWMYPIDAATLRLTGLRPNYREHKFVPLPNRQPEINDGA